MAAEDRVVLELLKTHASLTSSNPILYLGQKVIVTGIETDGYYPYKIGDGVTAYNSLPFVHLYRKDSAADFTSDNPTLLVGQHGYETDTGKEKIGDGSTAWTALEYACETGLVEQVATNVTNIAAKLTGVTDQLCKAWVNFDGTTNVGGKCTMRDSYNVDDVDDNGTGDYTINFTNNMSNANYSPSGVCGRPGVTDGYLSDNSTTAKTTSAFRFNTLSHTGAANNMSNVSVQIFGS